MGPSGLEPPTSRLSGVRSNHLSYEPIFTRVRQSSCHQLTGSRFNLLRGGITFVIPFSFQFALCLLRFVVRRFFLFLRTFLFNTLSGIVIWDENGFFSRSVDLCGHARLKEPFSLKLVEICGIEPQTPCLQSRCSPSWAIPPYFLLKAKAFKIKQRLLRGTTKQLTIISLYASCLHLYRHITQIRLWIRQYSYGSFTQSVNKSDCAIHAQ